QVLVFNYETKNWSFYDDCFTCFGYYYPAQSQTWATLTNDWSKTFETWDAETIAEKMEMKPQEISPPLPETKDEEVAPEAPKIEKKSVVATPSGIGTVLEVRNGKALIDIDGQKKQVDEDDLIQSPLPERDLADLHDDLIKGIEHETGEDVSRMVNFSGYDPNTNSLAFLPYDGALYIYDDLTDEEKATAMNLMAKRKTSGENHIGAWTKDTKSPAGAAMSAFIKKLQES
ncbi:unnamed protein product, partial [Sphagnum balticum]